MIQLKKQSLVILDDSSNVTELWPIQKPALVKVILAMDLVTLLQLLRNDDNPLATIEGLLGSSKSESESKSENYITRNFQF